MPDASPVSDTLVDLRRQLAEHPTLPELPHDADDADRAIAYANVAMAANDRLRGLVTVAELSHAEQVAHAEYVESRLDRLEALLRKVAAKLGVPISTDEIPPPAPAAPPAPEPGEQHTEGT